MPAITFVGGAVAVVGIFVLATLNAALTAVAIRFYRLRLSTRWATVLYVVVTIPVLYAVTTMIALGALGVGTGVTLQPDALYFLVWGLPLAVGASIEMFWMLPPEAFEDGADG
jgi:hypothetical protein